MDPARNLRMFQVSLEDGKAATAQANLASQRGKCGSSAALALAVVLGGGVLGESVAVTGLIFSGFMGMQVPTS